MHSLANACTRSQCNINFSRASRKSTFKNSDGCRCVASRRACTVALCRPVRALPNDNGAPASITFHVL